MHYTCHPNHGYPQRYVSSDWPGIWSEGVRELLGLQCVPVVINGCCGNIHHTNHLNPHHVDDHRRMGAMLTETTATILPRIEYETVDVLEWKYRHVPVPWRQYAPEVFADAHQMMEEYPQPLWTDDSHLTISWDWMYAVSVLDVEKQMQRSPAFDYEIQVLRIGEIALAALPGEPFVEGQLQIKLESPAYPTYVAHMSNIYGGYIPTEAGLARGGFETRPSNWSKLAPEALGLIADTTVEMLHELFLEKAQSGDYQR